ncbi:hypothetical protein [Plastoroseomonas hellenica]|uniref:hypothetical protein n=1 Tax=Plastoroseomonas hellenica TaxID=2687306 RepID=UPI001BA9BE3F|nr:hypothetical protein [Plastoroseomonas hellenica]MBR0641282.1 hypothetical protein [Plastoroseomonas hellenica]
MLDFWLLGMLGAFGILIALFYRAAMALSTRDSRREHCVSRLLSDQLSLDQQ